MNIKELIEAVTKQDTLLQDALTAIKEAAPSFADLFKGTFKDKLAVLAKGLATFLVIFKAKCLEEYGITEEEVIDKLSEWLDEKVTLPWYLEYVDGPVFHWIITYAANYVKPTDASPITAMYAKAFDEAVV